VTATIATTRIACALDPSIRIALTGFVFANHDAWDTDMAR
jgi:hypothetical protein